MSFEKMSWIGFTVVAAGWAMLFSAPLMGDLVMHLAGRPHEAAGFNVSTIAQCAILSGFGIGIIGALRTGFGALNRFFDAALARSGQPRAQSAAAAPAYSAPRAAAASAHSSQPAPKAIARPQPAHSRKILERGWVKDRAYVLFVDGSVEVETMLGRRMFPSLQEAQEFIS